jgi:hypothetical protein
MNTTRANPFSSKDAASHSCYAAFVDHHLVLPREGDRSPPPLARHVHKQLRSFILDSAFPCAGARAAFNQGTYRFGMYPEIASPATTAALSRDLFTFVQSKNISTATSHPLSPASQAPHRPPRSSSNASYGGNSKICTTWTPVTIPGIPRTSATRKALGFPSASRDWLSSSSVCTLSVPVCRGDSPGRHWSSMRDTSLPA